MALQTGAGSDLPLVLGLCGSLRTGSSNLAFLEGARDASESFATHIINESLGGLPHFNSDLEPHAVPPPVVAFRDRVARADALLLSTPEYAHGVPGVLKNALDWLVADPRFAGTRVGILMGSSTEGSFASEALVEILTTMSARVVPRAVIALSGSRARVVAGGGRLDESTRSRLRGVVEALLDSSSVDGEPTPEP